MKISIYLITLLAILVGGYASTETVKEAEGEGSSRTYNYAYDRVYNATLAAAKN